LTPLGIAGQSHDAQKEESLITVIGLCFLGHMLTGSSYGMTINVNHAEQNYSGLWKANTRAT